MSHVYGTADNAANLLDLLNTFLTATGKAFGPSYTGTGNGTISAWDGGASSVSETFTITATSSTSFNVVGSVSGSIGPATVGTTFTHAKLTFLLTAGTSAFVAGDVFQINTCPPWTSKRAVAGSEMIWMAPGNDGLREIYTGARLFSDAGADYYNWRLGGFNGYSSGVAFTSQPGFNGVPGPVLPLWNTTIPYWFVANGQRAVVVAKIGSVYVPAYIGFYNTYLSPGEYPYPMFVGGAMAWATEPASSSTNWRYSYTGTQIHSFWRGCPTNTTYNTDCSARIRIADGTYLGVENYTANNVIGYGGRASVWPFACDNSSTRGFLNIRENLDGSYPIVPIVFSYDRGNTAGQIVETLGELDGVFATTGHGNAPENLIIDGLLTYLVIQDVYRSSKDCFAAIALD